MNVFVKNLKGQALMPCSQKKARILLKEKKAKIINYNPFTIQLLYATGETAQLCNIGVDTGTKHIGIAVTSGNNVLYKSEVELRDNKDIKSAMDLRRSLRSSRRNRKTRYRKPRFDNRKKASNWLAPSIQARVNHTINHIDKIKSALPNGSLYIELGRFDVQKIKDPTISGKAYQDGDLKSYENIRQYVLYRDHCTCQLCGAKNVPLEIHHIRFRSKGGTDTVTNLITLCTNCHSPENHKEGGILYDWCQKAKKMPQYKEATLMNVVASKLKKYYFDANFTYGYITKFDRKELHLSKSHCNDAVAISGIKLIKKDCDDYLLLRQTHSWQRQLYDCSPCKKKGGNTLMERRRQYTKGSVNGFYRGDKVYVKSIKRKAYITGFNTRYVYLYDLDNKPLMRLNSKGKTINYFPTNDLKLICHNNDFRPYVKKEQREEPI